MIEARLIAMLAERCSKMVGEALQQLQAFSGGSEACNEAVAVMTSGIHDHHDSPQHISSVNGYIKSYTPVQWLYKVHSKLACNAYLPRHDELRLIRSMCDHGTACSQENLFWRLMLHFAE